MDEGKGRHQTVPDEHIEERLVVRDKRRYALSFERLSPVRPKVLAVICLTLNVLESVAETENLDGTLDPEKPLVGSSLPASQGLVEVFVADEKDFEANADRDERCDDYDHSRDAEEEIPRIKLPPGPLMGVEASEGRVLSKELRLTLPESDRASPCQLKE